MYFKPHCAPKLACLNKNNPKIPIVKEREWTNFKRKYFECQDVQIQQSTCICNLFLQSYAYRQEKKAFEISYHELKRYFFFYKRPYSVWCLLREEIYAWWVYAHGANDRGHKITISFSTIMVLLLLFDSFWYVLIKLLFYHTKTSLFWFWLLI